MFSTSLHFLSHAPPNLSHVHHRILPTNPLTSSILLRSTPRPSAPPPSPPSLLLASVSSSSSDPPPEPEGETESDFADGLEIEVSKVGLNRRRVQARVGIGAGLDVVWGVLTDYDGLAEFLPSLSVCRLLERKDNFVKIYQVGLQELALGIKFSAKVILDCYEKDLQVLPNRKTRDIDFRLVEGDFHTFEGTWSMTENDSTEDKIFAAQEFPSVLSYVVDIEPKLWLPVRLIEGRICAEVRNNLLCIREEAQKIQRVARGSPPSR